VQFHGVEAEQQILAEGATGDFSGKVGVGG